MGLLSLIDDVYALMRSQILRRAAAMPRAYGLRFPEADY